MADELNLLETIKRDKLWSESLSAREKMLIAEIALEYAFTNVELPLLQ